MQPAGLDIAALTKQEELRLVQSLFFANTPEAPRVVVFCGVGRGTGCSRVCVRVSETLAAHSEGSICVVDASLTPVLHDHFRIENICGWSEALAAADPTPRFVQRIMPFDLWLLPRGRLSDDLPLAVKRERVRRRLADLRGQFKYVVIDAPPANLFPDTAWLAALADGVVLVVEAHVTRRETARRARDDLTAAGGRLLGTVLNKRTFPVPDALYRRC
jgi:Mrp family chromosome partitioning ATPase